MYLSEKNYGLYLTLPKDYTLLPASDSAETNPEAAPSYLQAFHAPGGGGANLLGSTAVGGYTGLRVVEGTVEEAEKAASDAAIADLADAAAQGKVRLLAGPTVIEENDAFVTVEWRIAADVTGQGTSSVILQRSTIGLTSASPVGKPEAHVVKSLVIGCVEQCFAANAGQIDAIAESWRFN